MSRLEEHATPPQAPTRVESLRVAAGMSRRVLARRAGLGSRRLAAIERGEQASQDELVSLADALGTSVGSLAPVGGDLSVVHPHGSLHGDSAIEALLREYVSMVRELRGTNTVAPSSLRYDDLTELGRALGGTPTAIEARLVELLATDPSDAQRVRDAILPSSSCG